MGGLENLENDAAESVNISEITKEMKSEINAKEEKMLKEIEFLKKREQEIEEMKNNLSDLMKSIEKESIKAKEARVVRESFHTIDSYLKESDSSNNICLFDKCEKMLKKSPYSKLPVVDGASLFFNQVDKSDYLGSAFEGIWAKVEEFINEDGWTVDDSFSALAAAIASSQKDDFCADVHLWNEGQDFVPMQSLSRMFANGTEKTKINLAFRMKEASKKEKDVHDSVLRMILESKCLLTRYKGPYSRELEQLPNTVGVLTVFINNEEECNVISKQMKNLPNLTQLGVALPCNSTPAKLLPLAQYSGGLSLIFTGNCTGHFDNVTAIIQKLIGATEYSCLSLHFPNYKPSSDEESETLELQNLDLIGIKVYQITFSEDFEPKKMIKNWVSKNVSNGASSTLVWFQRFYC